MGIGAVPSPTPFGNRSHPRRCFLFPNLTEQRKYFCFQTRNRFHSSVFCFCFPMLFPLFPTKNRNNTLGGTEGPPPVIFFIKKSVNKSNNQKKESKKIYTSHTPFLFLFPILSQSSIHNNTQAPPLGGESSIFAQQGE